MCCLRAASLDLGSSNRGADWQSRWGVPPGSGRRCSEWLEMRSGIAMDRADVHFVGHEVWLLDRPMIARRLGIGHQGRCSARQWTGRWLPAAWHRPQARTPGAPVGRPMVARRLASAPRARRPARQLDRPLVACCLALATRVGAGAPVGPAAGCPPLGIGHQSRRPARQWTGRWLPAAWHR